MTDIFVLGFAFIKDNHHVVLIEKQKPDWQKGKLNGVGGKIEPGESRVDAMVREFMEETGCTTHTKDWKDFCRMKGRSGWLVHCFAHYNFQGKPCTITDEAVGLYHRENLPANVIPNLHWLIPMAWRRDCFAEVAYL